MGLFDFLKKDRTSKADKSFVPVARSNNLIENAENMLAAANIDLTTVDAVELPIAQLGTLGGGIASMLPALRTVSSTITYNDNGLYRCIFPNGVNGYLATAHSDGLNLGTIMNKKGIAAQARWVKAGSQTVKVSSVAPINPATLMMAAAIMAIEKKLDDVVAMEKQILSFLEEEKESKIDGDLRTLTTILKEYKFNWDNATYIATHHHLAADIRRAAEGDIILYQKQVTDIIKVNPALFLQKFVDSQHTTLIKKFKYYKRSVYLYAFASFVEVMLQGQYSQDYILQVRRSIIERADKYRELFSICMKQLEKLTESSVEHHVLKGIGAVGKAVGNFVGSIPVIKEGLVDEWLIENGSNLEQTGDNYGKEALKQFAAISDSGCSIFIDNLGYMDRLFNQTQEVYIGRDSVYLVKGLVD